MRRDELLDLNDVLQHPGRKLAVDISTEMDEESEFELLSPLTGFLEAVSTANLLLLTGAFEATAIVACARCGEPLEAPISFEVSEQFPVEGVPSSYGSKDFARVAPDEPYVLFEGNSLFVEALLRQDLVVAMPLQPLCQYGWDGACPLAKSRPDKPETKTEEARGPLAKLLKQSIPEAGEGTN